MESRRHSRSSFIATRASSVCRLLSLRLLLLHLPLCLAPWLHSASCRSLLQEGDAAVDTIAMVTPDADAALAREALQLRFNSFVQRYGKVYSSPEEHAYRMEVFKENLRLIEESNNYETYELEVTEFTDLTWEEFQKHFLGAKQDCSATTGSYVRRLGNPTLPARRDWREEGIVSPVKNQGHCGSCWTFSTTGGLEAAHAQATGSMVLLSEQQLLDCAGGFDNLGCSGGLPSHAYEYIIYAGGLDTEEAYPYKAKSEKCHFNPNAIGAKVFDVVNITEGAEDDILEAVALVQPVTVAFQVVDGFRFYKSGVYSSPTCKSGPETVNHAVLAVGYDVDKESGTPYWIIKNSWGPNWGNHGYFYIERNKNMCGIAACASYPVVTKGAAQSA
ncbi:hypothetical protein CBR_g10974 [Chara braunii]|uniref:Uncharacterized protein n=1 Tax=Chara braunii TaxID=69332 RepID=A0A388KPR2_CHABU|nr:hypothetical protein CBR_g10974 [Chara braunii]|eukprot:GBG72039.1 hypothetical protein CBR_g10974 [Chara braunii]